MKPANLKTKIFLDSGDPKETKETLELLGFLDGQTTNPSLIAKNPDAVGKKFTSEEIYSFYKKVVSEVSVLLPQGSVSVEVYADKDTKAEAMVTQAREFYAWIPNAHIKLPTTFEGLKAAEILSKEHMRLNMTLVFSQEQAAAVYSATRGADKGQIYISPFIGRLDDIGLNGLDLIKNIAEMYKKGDGHVEVLAASVRSVAHQAESIAVGADIITSPIKVLKEWKDLEMPQIMPVDPNHKTDLKHIEFEDLDLEKPWQEFNILHELTAKCVDKFAEDWNKLIEQK